MPPLTAGTPDWWLHRLDTALAGRQHNYSKLDDYYTGRHPMAFASRKFREAFGGLFSAFADNWMQIVVDAVEERLNVEGFRLGADQDERGDTDAWKIWQANQLDADSQIAHTEALVYGESYILVWPGDEYPTITVESPRQTIVMRKSGSRRRRAAGLKKWVDDDGYEVAYLYLPEWVYKYRSKRKSDPMFIGPADPSRWEPLELQDEDWPLPNPLGVVPLVPLVNRPRLHGDGMSELANVIPTQDAVNKLVADMLVASEYAAFPQRWATGFEIPSDPETGEALPNAELRAALSRLWASDDPETKFGQFQAADLSNYKSAIEMLVQHIASQTRTPPHYFYLSGQFPSGESIKSAETGLVAKARRKMRHFGEAWEEVIRLGFATLGDDRAQSPDAEAIWGDPESRSESEHIDSVVKKKALNVPMRALWEDAGYTPQQIVRFESALAREQLFTRGVDLADVLPVSDGQ